MRVGDILEEKGRYVWSIEPHRMVIDALALMREKNVGALLVLKGEEMKGILSERDYARKVFIVGKSSRDTPVSEIMTPRVVTVEPETPVGDCMKLMTDKRVRHLPVLDGGKLAGIISIGDVVKGLIRDHKAFYHELLHFMEGHGFRV